MQSWTWSVPKGTLLRSIWLHKGHLFLFGVGVRNWGVLQPGKPHGRHAGRAGLRKDGSSLQGSWSQEVLCRLVTVPDLPQPFFFFLASQKLVNQIAYHSHLLTTFLPTSQDKNPDVDQKSSKAVLRLSTVRWDREKALGWTQKLFPGGDGTGPLLGRLLKLCPTSTMAQGDCFSIGEQNTKPPTVYLCGGIVRESGT